MKLIIEDSDIKETQDMIWDYMGVKVPKEVARAALEPNAPHAYAYGITDTEIRSDIMNEVAEMLVDRTIPRYGNKDSSFYDEIDKAASKRGWEIREVKKD